MVKMVKFVKLVEIVKVVRMTKMIKMFIPVKRAKVVKIIRIIKMLKMDRCSIKSRRSNVPVLMFKVIICSPSVCSPTAPWLRRAPATASSSAKKSSSLDTAKLLCVIMRKPFHHTRLERGPNSSADLAKVSS